jgi:serine/threonine-protein phosphatase 6 regulatory subunit 3
VLVEPSDEADTKRCFKYPFVSAEVLSNDLEKVVSLFFKEPGYMERLLDFLKTDKLNFTLAGYFAKVITSLFCYHSHSVLAAALDVANCSKDLVRHVASRSIAEVIERLLAFEEPGSNAYIPERKQLLDLLVDAIAPETEIESINASSIIVNFLGKQTSVVRWEEVARHLATRATIERIMRHLYSCNTIVVKSLVSVLIAIISHAPLKSDAQGEDDTTLYEAEVPPVVELLATHLDKLVAYIKEPRAPVSRTTFKVAIPVLGEDRLKLCELLGVAMKLDEPLLNKRLISEKVPSLFVEMFVEFPWNSSYHKCFESFVNAVLDSSDNSLKTALILEAELPRYLVELSDNGRFPTEGVEIRRGNLGFVTRISNLLVKHAKDDLVKQLLAKFPSWDCYVCEALQERNEIENQPIAGQKSRAFIDDQFFGEEEEAEPKPLFSGDTAEIDEFFEPE